MAKWPQLELRQQNLSPDKHSATRVRELNSEDFWEELNYHQTGTWYIQQDDYTGKYLSNLKINTTSIPTLKAYIF
jgi:hypothetical protein